MIENLHGLRVLVTRPAPQGRILCDLIETQGGKSIYFPTISYAGPQDEALFLSQIKTLSEQHWIIFISAEAVARAMPLIANIERYQALSYAAVGAGTQKALSEHGIQQVIAPSAHYGSEALLALAPFQAVKEQKIAIVKGEGGREWLVDTLRQRGALVTEINVYRRQLPNVTLSLATTCPEVMVATSYEAVRNLKTLAGENQWAQLKTIPLVVVSERIKILAHNLGFQTIWVTFEASNAAILASLSRMSRIMR